MIVPQTKSLLNWYGGKFRSRKWVLGYLANYQHDIYCEPFGGGAVHRQVSRFETMRSDLLEGGTQLVLDRVRLMQSVVPSSTPTSGKPAGKTPAKLLHNRTQDPNLLPTTCPPFPIISKKSEFREKYACIAD